jgi:spore germination protein YaaH
MKNFIISVVIVVLLAFGGYYFYMYHALLEDQQAKYLYNQLVINGQSVDQVHLREDSHGRQLLSVKALSEIIDPSVYLSGSKSRIYIPMLGKNVRLETSKLTEFVRQHIETINMPIKRIEDVEYVELEVIKKLYGLSVMTFEDYKVTVIDNRRLPTLEAKGKKIKLYGDSEKGFVSIGKYGVDTLCFLGEKNGHQLVLTNQGQVAFVKDHLESNGERDYFVEGPLNTPRIDNNMPENFVLTWHQVGTFKDTADIGPQDPMPVDVVSPTWFALNVDGIVINEASYDYVTKAHNKGYKVWGLYSNSFKPDWTQSLFESDDYSNQSIAQLLVYSALYDLDGINFDFENIYLANKADYVRYIEATVNQLQYQNLRTSLDVTVPWGSDQWSKVYDRVELSKLVDYMCLMAYDEFWAASKKAGPVASMAWVEKGITESLKLIPREKLVLAIPMYMRTWAMQANGTAKSKSMGWKTASSLKQDLGGDIIFDKTSGQNFLTYNKEGVTYKLWLEDDYSLPKRMEMSRNYNLAGTAIWSKGFANEEAWEIIRNER